MTSIGRSSLGQRLVERFVDGILNSHETDVIDEIIDSKYQDFDPLDIPGYPPRAIQGIEYVRQLCAFLSLDIVDIAFTLEDSFGESDRVAYQMFGEGTVRIAVPTSEEFHDSPNRVVSDDAASPANLGHHGQTAQQSSPEAPNRLLGDKLHVQYHSVGIFRIRDDCLIQRHGPILLR